MKVEIILRIQDTKYEEKVDKYRCLVEEERADYVIQKYQKTADEYKQNHRPYGIWVLANLLNDKGEFEKVIL